MMVTVSPARLKQLKDYVAQFPEDDMACEAQEVLNKAQLNGHRYDLTADLELIEWLFDAIEVIDYEK